MSQVTTESRTVQLYNKYRPRKFSELRGQDELVQGLTKAVLGEQPISQVYMLEGGAGCGKTTTARIFTAALNCPFRPADSPEPCGECELCEGTLSGEGASGYEEINGTKNSGVDATREFFDRLLVGLSSTRFQVKVIDESHGLSKAAQSVCLKYIEEPPSDKIIFIFCTTDPDKMLDTILSRSMRLKINRISRDEMTDLVKDVAVKEGQELTDKEASNIVSAGRGSGRTTLSMLQKFLNGFGIHDDDTSHKLMDFIVRRDLAEAIGLIAEHYENIDPQPTFEYGMNLYRDALMLNRNSKLVDGSEEYLDTIKWMTDEYGEEALMRMLTVTAEAFDTIRSSGNNVRLILESYAARIALQEGSTSVEHLAGLVKKMSKEIAQLKSMLAHGVKVSGAVENQQDENPWDVDPQSVDTSWPDTGDEEVEERKEESTRSGSGRRRRKLNKGNSEAVKADLSDSTPESDVDAKAEENEPLDERVEDNDEVEQERPRRKRRSRSEESEESSDESPRRSRRARRSEETDEQEDEAPRKRRSRRSRDEESEESPRTRRSRRRHLEAVPDDDEHEERPRRSRRHSSDDGELSGERPRRKRRSRSEETDDDTPDYPYRTGRRLRAVEDELPEFDKLHYDEHDSYKKFWDVITDESDPRIRKLLGIIIRAGIEDVELDEDDRVVVILKKSAHIGALQKAVIAKNLGYLPVFGTN